MKKSKIVALTLIAYLTLFVLLGILPNDGKLSMLVFLTLLGYSVFNIVALLVWAYKFIKNKISGKKEEPAIIDQKEAFVSNNITEQQQVRNEEVSLIDQRENIKNENINKKSHGTTGKMALGIGLGCILGPFIGYFLYAIVMLMIMGLVGGVYSAIPPSWKSCNGVVILVDPITHTNSIFGKKGGVIYYKSGGNDIVPASCKILKNADFASFEVVGEIITADNTQYNAKDKNNLYWGGKIVRANVNKK